MTNIYPVTLERHADRAWNKGAGFGWARQNQVVPIALQEAMQLVMSFPLSFLKHEGRYQFIALLGLRSDENLMIGGDGRWLASRVPTALRNYPFRLMRDTEGREFLGVDETGLLPVGSTEGTRLYDENAQPLAELTSILEQLTQADRDQAQALQIAAILEQHGLLEPWKLQVQDGSEILNVEGLYRVNEIKFKDLPADTLLALRNTGGLSMIYLQLLSMQHVQQLVRIAEAQTAARLRMAQARATEKDPGGEHGIISFANL